MSHPHTKTLVAGLAITILMLGTPSIATEAARLLWQTELPPPLASGVYEGVNSIAIARGVVIAGGWIDGIGHADMAIRAYDRRSGSPLWQERLDVADGYDAAHSVAAQGELATVIGEFRGEQAGLAVRTYEARTGMLLWEDRLVGGGSAIDLRSGVVAAAGAIPIEREYQPVIRAWSARGGETLWTHLGSDGDDFRDIAIRGGLVIGAGSTIGETGETALLVRALDRRGGGVVWQDVWEAGQPTQALELVAWGNLLLVAGFVGPSDAPGGMAIRAYRRTTGELLWDHVVEGSAWRVAVAGGGRTAVLAGGLDGDFVVRAYDAKKGDLKWSDRIVDSNGAAEAVAVGRRAVVVAGWVSPVELDNDFVVRAYDRRDGSVWWADQYDVAERTDAAVAVAVDGGAVVAGGWLARSGGRIYFALRAYAL